MKKICDISDYLKVINDIMGVKLRRALHGEYHIFSHAMQRTL